MTQQSLPTLTELQRIAASCGLRAIGVADLNMSAMQPGMTAWLDAGYHGSMDYLARNLAIRDNPAELLPGAQSAIVIRMDYLPSEVFESDTDQWNRGLWDHLDSPTMPYISVYARGRDYHKVLKARLKILARHLEDILGEFGHRICCDSAPVYEVELGRKAGLGWRGKHTLLLNREAGSFFFLAEILTTLPITTDTDAGTEQATTTSSGKTNQQTTASKDTNPASEGHCGRCTRCIDICPTQAIIAPYQLDARRCISYLTIEFDGVIPEAFRPAIGNRIYGCDDCQLVCPWNKFAQQSAEADFQIKSQWRTSLDGEQLIIWLGWDEASFLKHTEGTAIRRIGHQRWQRNLAIAIGNALEGLGPHDALRQRLQRALEHARQQASAMVLEHIDWALKH